MLDKESMETYKNIRLDRDLRPGILTRHEEKHRAAPVRYLRPAAVLASLLLVVSVSGIAASRTGDGAYLDGSRVGRRARTVVTESVNYAGGIMRAFALPDEGEEIPLQTAEGCIPLTMRYGRDVCITVTGGILLVPDAENIPTFAGQSGFAPDGAVIYWIPGGSESLSPLSARLFDTVGNPLAALTLTYDTENAQWRIAADKNETK